MYAPPIDSMLAWHGAPATAKQMSYLQSLEARAIRRGIKLQPRAAEIGRGDASQRIDALKRRLSC